MESQIYYSINEIKEKKYRCYHCAKSHRKCDKKLPSCSTCLKRSLNCTYLKREENDKHLNSINKLAAGLKNYQGNNDKRGDKDKDNALNSLKIRKLPKGYNMMYTPLGLIHRFKKRNAFENLMTLFQFPSLSKLNNGLTLLSTLVEKIVSVHIKKMTTRRYLTEIEERNIPNLEDLSSKAINNYFKYNNAILPIFIKSKFNFNSKSEILKTAIVIAGISHMEKDEHSDYLNKQLSCMLEKSIGKINRIKPTLETIQALTISLAFCMNLSFLFVHMDKYLLFCHKASDLIGLHLTSPGLTKTQKIERDMTYSSLCVMYLFYRNNIGSYLYLPYRPKTLNKEYKAMTEYITNEKENKVIVLKDNLDYYFNLTMSSYNNVLSSILFSLRLLKEKYLITDSKIEDLLGPTETLIKRIERLKNHYLLIFSQLNTKLLQNGSVSSKFNYEDHILFIYHYLMFYVYSFKLYYPMNGNVRVSHFDYLKDNTFITKILLECNLAIHHGTRLSSYYLNRFNISCLTQCLVFLLRYTDQGQDKATNVVEKGISYIKKLSKIERLNTSAIFNLNVIDYVESKNKNF